MQEPFIVTYETKYGKLMIDKKNSNHLRKLEKAQEKQ